MSEFAYLNHMEDLLHAPVTENRTGVDTRTIFGHQMRFDLADGFPLLTTKKVHLKSIIHELLWFLSGETNTRYLKENGVTIWDEWEDENGDLGPVYGSQWRNFNGVDQILWAEDRLKKNPFCRRIVVSAWNPADIDKMALPPCHMFFQFHVDKMQQAERVFWLLDNVEGGQTVIDSARNTSMDDILDHFDVPDKKLSCHMYQRSADWFLGVPFNIASYSLLTMMMANSVGMAYGDFVHSFGNTHLYVNHEEQALTQINRKVYEPPIMIIRHRDQGILDYRYEDFILVGYESHGALKAEVAV